jgi:glutamine cyclotransferase
MIREMRRLVAATVLMLVATVLMLSGQGTGAPPRLPPPGSKAPVAGFIVVNSYPHDPAAFTQGLEYRDGFLYEGTGMQARSGIRRALYSNPSTTYKDPRIRRLS